MDDGLDEAFSRLAQSRTNPHVLDIGLTAQDIQSTEILSPVDWDQVNSTTAAEKTDHLFGF
ncbi:Low density lipoprotein receptor adapter protein 1 [Varanus komodoensis]|nr:Low density lipoprotein receptor adapter protein 1 [Varanus komodoensis]